MLEWLIEWYKSQCNGDWEHLYGITIESLDNPGWSVSIDLVETNYSLGDLPWKYYTANESDWYGYKVEGNVYKASGDSDKLEYLLEIFKNLVENGDDAGINRVY